VNKPCDFDYGSPLVQDGVAVGILSQQNNCQSSPYDSSMYIRLASYYNWIREEAFIQPRNCFKSTTTTSSTQTTQESAPTTTSTTMPTSTETTPSTVTTSTTIQPTVPPNYVCQEENGFFPIDPGIVFTSSFSTFCLIADLIHSVINFIKCRPVPIILLSLC